MKWNYIVIPLMVIGVSITGNFFTSQGMMGWYETINLPSWTPAGEIVGIAWSIIFFLTAISLLLFWNKSSHKSYKFKIILFTFILNGILNVIWSFLFFYEHLIGLAALDAGLLALTVLILIVELWPVSKTAAVLLIPYVAWVSFATFLNYSIFLLN